MGGRYFSKGVYEVHTLAQGTHKDGGPGTGRRPAPVPSPLPYGFFSIWSRYFLTNEPRRPCQVNMKGKR
jgi:hypothetical protein